MNKEAVKELVHRNKTTEAFFEALAQRERSARNAVTNLGSFILDLRRRGYNPNMHEIKDTFKELESAGVGRLTDNKFEWHENMRQVAKVASTEVREKPLYLKEKVIHIVLANRRDVKIEMPSKLTKDEADFICKLILQETK